MKKAVSGVFWGCVAGVILLVLLLADLVASAARVFGVMRERAE
jgi:uncharacterized membrane protein